MAELLYHPEINDQKPAAEFEATRGHRGNYYIKTPKTLTGRGVTLVRVLKESDLVPQARHEAGWNQYRLTDAAYAKLCKDHAVSFALLLD